MKKNLSILENRLAKYSLTAGVVLIGTVNLKGGVVYTNPADQSNLGEFSIDFNSDSNIDLLVRADLGTPSDAVALSDVRIEGGNGKVFGYNGTTSYSWNFYGSAINTGVTIGPSGSFAAASKAQVLVYSSRGPWPGANQKLLGVKFDISGQTHYGWVKLSCSSSQPYRFTLYEYAYEDTPNTAINSGAMPVELTNFSAVQLENAVKLLWETATEVNNYGFNVERQVVGKEYISSPEWETIGFVTGHGNSNSPKYYEFMDENPPAAYLRYRLKQVDTDGSYEYYNTIPEVNAAITSVSGQELPEQFNLSQNYPNPFNPATTISFSLPENGNVKLSVFNSLGELVETLVNGQLSAGEHEIGFNANDLPSGFYTYRIDIDGKYVETKKMLLVK